MESSDECTYRAENSIAGNQRALQALRELIIYPFLYREEARILGLEWPGGLLLSGPPGTGKTSLVQAVVQECGAHLTLIHSRFVHRPNAGEGEKFLRDSFAKAYKIASSGRPSVIFIDEIDAMCPRRDNRKGQSTRIVAQLNALMDRNNASNKPLPHVAVVAATNRIDSIDAALRRSGRFDKEIDITVPSKEERLQILELYCKKHPSDETVDLKAIANSCFGYVGADLKALFYEAASSAYERSLTSCPETPKARVLCMEDWEVAKRKVGPSLTKGIAKEVPKVTWDDIGGLKDVKKKLQQAVEWPIKHGDSMARLGISPVRGVLLHGPPGCSKTTLVKAAVHASQASFFSLSGAELRDMYVGEGEALLRRIFKVARQAAPSIIFFDEADVIASQRSCSSSDTVSERLLSTLLTEMDGLEEAKGITVLAATNRPQAIDAALLRPGRFDMVLFVPPPDEEGRLEILRIRTRKMKLGEDVDLPQIAESTDNYTGADLGWLCNAAGMVAMSEADVDSVSMRHFVAARGAMAPSLSPEDLEEYQNAVQHQQHHSSRMPSRGGGLQSFARPK